MAALLKDMFNQDSISELSEKIQSVYNTFQKDDFMNSVMDETWDDLELKARCRKITMELGKYLPSNYKEALMILEKAVHGLSFASFFPDFIEVYGTEDCYWDLSIQALERTTEYWTAEFTVRAFIKKNQEKMMNQLYQWSQSKNEHVRRLASEGCRPQLPWGQAIPQLKKDPLVILPILEQLKADPSLYVLKSVANNLNDISKTHPDLVMDIAKKWYGHDKNTDWILKHGCRTLLKAGNPDMLKLFGYDDISSIDITDFVIETPIISIGEDLVFSFMVFAKTDAKIRLEYIIDYVKSNGKRSEKIFKISEITLTENSKKKYVKRHSFMDRSVRKHYPGMHTITLVVNGIKQGQHNFELMS